VPRRGLGDGGKSDGDGEEKGKGSKSDGKDDKDGNGATAVRAIVMATKTGKRRRQEE
jgi:hypothetical protein